MGRLAEWARSSAAGGVEAVSGVLAGTQLSTAPVPEYKGYTFWSTDFHISPIADLKDLFKPLG